MTDSLLDRFDCDSAQLTRHLGDVLVGADDGELLWLPPVMQEDFVPVSM